MSKQTIWAALLAGAALLGGCHKADVGDLSVCPPTAKVDGHEMHLMGLSVEEAESKHPRRSCKYADDQGHRASAKVE